MSLRRAAAILALTSLSSCTIPRTGIVVGTGTMVTGGALLAQSLSYQSPSCSGYGCGVPRFPDFKAFGAVLEGLAGATIVTVGVGVLISSLIGLALEKPEPTYPVEFVPAPAPAPATVADVQRLDTPEAIELRDRLPTRLALEAHLLARVGRCKEAVLSANKLAALDNVKYRDLIANDDHVARCITW